MHDYLSQLNTPQREAVENIKGPSLVIAGAGSGKTRVLTYRIAHLLNSGVPANKILALTFTNKAAREMKERIADVVGESVARNLWMGTFHSIFSRILRAESESLGYPSNFTIYDSSDTKNVLKKVVKELSLDEKTYKPGDMYSRISGAKNNLITARAYMNNDKLTGQDRMDGKPRVVDVYREYTVRCFRSGAMDFDDLLLNTNVLFRDNADALAKYQNMFQYILVDEYQDTNYSQYLIIKRLAEKHHNITVVGDDAQSIYSFRGAQIENILNFRNDYPEYKLYKLEQNYRSTQTIVNAANSLIQKNQKQIKKNSYSQNDLGNKIQVVKSLTDKEEAYKVADMIQDMQYEDRLKHADFAILYRTNAQSRNFEEALRKKNIPYRVFGSISFYARKEIKDLLAYLRLVINPQDDEALTRVINYPARGLGKVTLEKLSLYAANKNISQWEVVSNISETKIELNNPTKTKLAKFADMIKGFQEKLYNTDAFELADKIANVTGIMADLKSESTPENISKLENLEELLNAIQEYSQSDEGQEQTQSLVGFMENVALITDADTNQNDDRNKVSLMTVHASKGLEFPVVFLGGLEEDLFPSKLSVTSVKDLEEERRLFYVAITRAETKAIITCAESRYKFGTLNFSRPSRFIFELDSQYVELSDNMLHQAGGDYQGFSAGKKGNFGSSGFGKSSGSGSSVSNFGKSISRPGASASAFGKKPLVRPGAMNSTGFKSGASDFKHDPPEKLQSGMNVDHARFGAGKILQIEGEGTNKKATVFFQTAGKKQLLLKFAKLRIRK